MPANAGTTKSSISHAIAVLSFARKLPLVIACLGEACYLEDDLASGDYCAPRMTRLGECQSLESAMAFVEQLGRQPHIDIRDDSAVGFLPLLFFVEDDEYCLVLAGEPGPHGVT